MAGCCPAVGKTSGMSAAWFLMSWHSLSGKLCSLIQGDVCFSNHVIAHLADAFSRLSATVRHANYPIQNARHCVAFITSCLQQAHASNVPIVQVLCIGMRTLGQR